MNYTQRASETGLDFEVLVKLTIIEPQDVLEDVMVNVTVQLSDSLAEQFVPAQRWSAPLMEIGLARLKTSASITASEIVEFLLGNPTTQDLLDFHVSDRGQVRMQRLLALNEAGLLGESEQNELDELELLEHILISLKAQVLATESGPRQD